MMTIEKHLKHIVAAGIFMMLAACQTVSGPSPSATMRLENAGYEGLASARGASTGAASLSAVYICAPAKCGKLNVVVYGGGTGTVSPIITAEEQIRRGVFTDADARRLFQVAAASQNDKDFKISQVRQFVTPSEVGFTFIGTGTAGGGQRLFVRGRGVVVGNMTNVVVSLSENAAQAQRGLDLATVR